MVSQDTTASVQSMTGFGRADGEDAQYRWAWEVRSVNGRGLDIRLRVGMGFERLDPDIRKTLSKTFSRGSLTASLDVRSNGETTGVQINEPLLQALEDLCRSRGQEPALDRLLGVRGVLDAADEKQSAADDADRCRAVLATLSAAVAQLTDARRREGRETADVLFSRLDEMERLVAAAEALDAAKPAAIRERLAAQVADMLGDAEGVDAGRLAQEVALLAAKADVREELDRLSAHITSARDLLNGGGPIGRKLEFLTQELNREANTLCSKSPSTDLTQVGLDLKSVVDQIKEQSANLE